MEADASDEEENEEESEEENEVTLHIVMLYDTAQSAKPTGSLLLLQPPFASVKVRYLRLHLADTEGHLQVDEYHFAICTAKTNFEKVALSHQQEVLIDVAGIQTYTRVNGQPNQSLVMLMVKHQDGVPKFNRSIALPINTALRTPVSHSPSGGTSKNCAGGMFPSTSSTIERSSGRAKAPQSSTKAAYKMAKTSALVVVAQKVGVVDSKHAQTFLEFGHRALLEELRQGVPPTPKVRDLMGVAAAEKPQHLPLPFGRLNRRFFGCWRDDEGVKIGCAACAFASKGLHKEFDGDVRAAIFKDTDPSVTGIIMAGSNKNGITNFQKHVKSVLHMESLHTFLSEK